MSPGKPVHGPLRSLLPSCDGIGLYTQPQHAFDRYATESEASRLKLYVWSTGTSASDEDDLHASMERDPCLSQRILTGALYPQTFDKSAFEGSNRSTAFVVQAPKPSDRIGENKTLPSMMEKKQGASYKLFSPNVLTDTIEKWLKSIRQKGANAGAVTHCLPHERY